MNNESNRKKLNIFINVVDFIVSLPFKILKNLFILLVLIANECDKKKQGGITMKSKSKLKEHIECFIDERLEENRDNVLSNKEFRKLSNEYLELYDEIEAGINNEKVTDKYKDIELNLKRIELQEMYKMGIKDVVRFLIEG